MIKTLRKRHLQIWILWAILLPVGIIVAWMAVPKNATEELLQNEKIDFLPIQIDTQAEKGKYYSTLNTNRERSKYQLQWKIYNGFDYSTSIYNRSSLLIYRVTNTEYELIGRIGGNRQYYFNLANDSSDRYSFIIYDPIRKEKVDSINFYKNR